MGSSRKSYTFTEIEALWEDYNVTKVMQITKNGVETWQPLNGKPIDRLDATAAEIVDISEVIEFPEYLEMIEEKDA